ncbi:MAG: hypothetical protein J6T35_02185 [Bacteroidales bacterium]|nr:hypothetical protein [Bacteroidales bacterium]
MTREEAINEIKSWDFLEGKEIEAIHTLIPELRESEDEQALRIIKKRMCYDPVPISDEDRRIVENWLKKQKEQIPYIDFVIKPHKGDDNNPYDMRVSEAQEYAIKRGFGVPFNDGEVYVDERHITQTIGNILRWADDHPKEQKPVEWSEEDEDKLKKILATIQLMGGRVNNNATNQSLIDWLKALSKRFSLQPIQEWSEEDEEMRKRAICACNFTIKMIMREDHYGKARDWLKSLPIGFITNPNYNSNMIELLVSELQEIANKNGSPKQYDAEISWLKSLRPSWRPSEEQMEALCRCVDYLEESDNEDADIMTELYEQLKRMIQI